MSYPPVFQWPPRPLEALRWLPSYLYPWNAAFLAIALVLWLLATPSAETLSSLRPGWVLFILARNLAVAGLLYSLAHWALYRRRIQDDRFKFNPRWPRGWQSNRTLGNQHRETVLWTLVSGVPIWTAWEVATLWLMASGRIPSLSWADNPVWFVTLFVVILVFREAHFYLTHRLIHWRPLYRAVHSLHHRNVNPGPWSGLSMHPVEHLLYFSALALHWVVVSHPVHVIFTGVHLALAPIPGHLGFERLVVGPITVGTNGYAHYLHH
ncbi:MAG: sterol desaturase family protein, partial [Acidimicrobiia bacterium]|nr:sterol desaturase family protein [Acidimicrobiia bacterium]